MQKTNSFLSFFRKKKKFFYFIGGIALLVFLIFIFRNGQNEEQIIVAQLSDFKNQISVSGKVIPSSNVDLAFKNSGRVEKVYFSMDQFSNNGKIIKAGTLLAQIEAKNIRKDLHDAEISLENAKLSLAKSQLQNSEENMNADLQQAYDDGFVVVSNAFLDLSVVKDNLENIIEAENVSDNLVRISGRTALNYKEQAEILFYKAKNTFQNNNKNFRLLDRNSSAEDIDKIINETYEMTKVFLDALKSSKNLVDYLAEDTDNSSNYSDSKETLYEDIEKINDHLADLLSIKNEIKDNLDTFGNTELDTKSLLLSIKQKENDLQEIRSELEDYYIRAPFDGLITKIEAKAGEIVSSNIPIISMMSADTFQIESFIPEVNIALVKLGDEANITLDAYGENINFSAKVISIDPAETIQNGVSTYKIKLQFLEKDERIKSGMTANVLITAVNKPNVIVLPQGVIFEKMDKKFVQIKKNKDYFDTEITTGEISSLGQVEIISGINVGDEIVLKPVIK
jgi:HlyD family secretion protein